MEIKEGGSGFGSSVKPSLSFENGLVAHPVCVPPSGSLVMVRRAFSGN